MRVAMLCSWPERKLTGGVAVHIKNLVTNLSDYTDISLSVISFDIASESRPEGKARIILLKRTIWDYAIPLIPLARLTMQIRKIKPDIVHVQGINLSPYLICAMFLSRKPKKVITLHAHPTLELIAQNRLRKNSMRHRFLTWLETKAIHKSDAIISVGNRLKDWALEELGNSGKEKVFVIPNGVDTRLFDVKNHAKSLRKELGLANEDFIILHAKQLVENNGQRFLIESITDISRVVPKVKLVLAGDGPLMEALGELTHTLGVSDRVVFTGDIPNPVVADYLAVSDVVVVPSIRLKGAEEASGIFLVEAMAMGRPVVASNIGGLAETITHDVNGILVPEKDSDAIARNVIRLHDNPSFARTLGSNARRYAEEQRSWTQAARATLQVYEWCLRAAGAEQDRVIESVG